MNYMGINIANVISVDKEIGLWIRQSVKAKEDVK